MADPKPTLHHLNHSQSQRILWLLEELDVPYNLELHYRQDSGPDQMRAPPELKETNVLGKAPQLVTDDGRVITESSAIAKYLIAKYDTKWQFVGNSTTGNDDIRDEMLTSFAGTSIMPMANVSMVFDLMTKRTPFLIRPLMSLLYGFVNRSFLDPELRKLFTFLNDELKDQEYFMGERPGRADFIISWSVDFCAQRGYMDLADHPKLQQWHERCQARPAWKESLNKGNGYDLTVF